MYTVGYVYLSVCDVDVLWLNISKRSGWFLLRITAEDRSFVLHVDEGPRTPSEKDPFTGGGVLNLDNFRLSPSTVYVAQYMFAR